MVPAEGLVGRRVRIPRDNPEPCGNEIGSHGVEGLNIAFGVHFQQRHREIETGLPFVLDLLTLSVEAGLNFTAALEKVVQKGPKTPLRDELDRHDLALVQLVTPVTSDERLHTLCGASRGFVYAVTVTGINAGGQEFEEITDLSSISSQEAVFWLKNKVTIGSKLVLSLNVPKTLILENQLNLIVSGEVTDFKSENYLLPRKVLRKRDLGNLRR